MIFSSHFPRIFVHCTAHQLSGIFRINTNNTINTICFCLIYPIRELTVVLFIFFIYFLIFYYCYFYFFSCLCLIVNDMDLNQCFGLFLSIYVQQSQSIIKDTKTCFLNIIWNNGLVVKALDSQSRGPMFKNTGWLQAQLSLSSLRDW